MPLPTRRIAVKAIKKGLHKVKALARRLESDLGMPWMGVSLSKRHLAAAPLNTMQAVQRENNLINKEAALSQFVSFNKNLQTLASMG